MDDTRAVVLVCLRVGRRVAMIEDSKLQLLMLSCPTKFWLSGRRAEINIISVPHFSWPVASPVPAAGSAERGGLADQPDARDRDGDW